jgi:homoserine kinase
MASDSIKVFCPATVANVSCGFDVLGLALDTVGDEMTLTKTDTGKVRITEILGQDLPLEADKNVAGVAVMALLEKGGFTNGFDIKIDKRIKPGSGIGSSAASSAGAVWAVNHLLGNPFDTLDLVRFAMEGEKLASGAAHADNVAPALYGGFTLVRSYDPLDIIKIDAPTDLHATVIHPQIQVKTADSRNILKQSISLKDGIKQWGNLGGLIAGLYTQDYALIGRSLEDHIVEPLRAILIPQFQEVKQAVLEAGALGSGISGSGPSIFALSEGAENAEKVAQAMYQVYSKTGIEFDIHRSPINASGVKIL